MEEERYTIESDKMNEILSRARYSNEVNRRDNSESTNITEVLWSELSEVVRSLGLSTLWILEDWAKDLKKRNNPGNTSVPEADAHGK